MREPNYHSVAQNRAAVTITTSLYDRRALDVTSDKPLVNSLNHLTYLVSSSAKVRETLSTDGGLERLVEILHECQISPHIAREGVFHGERKLLTAWKWTLAFQCLVLIGTRGTEKIRQKVVCAGMLPVIATVLDNYITLHEGTFFSATACVSSALAQFGSHAHTSAGTAHPQYLGPYPTESATPAISVDDFQSFANQRQFASARVSNGENFVGTNIVNNHSMPSSQECNASRCTSRPGLDRNELTRKSLDRCPNSFVDCTKSEEYDMLSVEQSFKFLRESYGCYPIAQHPKSSINNDIRRRCLILSILKKLKESKEHEVIYPCDMNECEYEMDSSLQFLSDLYLQEEKVSHQACTNQSKTAPRSFTDTGIIIPRDDDVVWCLQLLAYISKYPYLKDVLQNTHLLINMSIRDKDLHLHSKEVVKQRCRRQVSAEGKENLKSRQQSKDSLSSTPLPVHPTSSNNQDETSLERFNPSPSNSPEFSDVNLHNNEFDLADDNLDLYADVADRVLVDRSDHKDNREPELDSQGRDIEDAGNHLATFRVEESAVTQSSCRLEALFKEIADAESTANSLDRELALCRLSDQVNNFIDEECRNLASKVIDKRIEQKNFLSDVWNYDTYDNFDIDEIDSVGENDYDISLMEYRKVNLFPAVEKFTFLAGTDMYYWSGVIMRNSCRRNDSKGGIRQCGNLECGKWEQMPREFSKCKRCKRTKYCSRDCQMRSWHCHKNWCVPSNTSTSTNVTESSNATYDGHHERSINMGAITSDSETIITNTRDTSQHVPGTDDDNQYSDL